MIGTLRLNVPNFVPIDLLPLAVCAVNETAFVSVAFKSSFCLDLISNHPYRIYDTPVGYYGLNVFNEIRQTPYS